ncbi:MAG: archease [Candidatus Aenigmatarchaeota archaeon]
MTKPDFSKKFKFLEEIATADVAFEAYGSSEAELFENAALAVEETMVRTADVKAKIKKKIELESDELDKLLFDFLSELVYFKDADALLFSSFKVSIKSNRKFRLSAQVAGERIDPARHELRNDIKAITWHMFKVERTPKGWMCRIIVDV